MPHRGGESLAGDGLLVLLVLLARAQDIRDGRGAAERLDAEPESGGEQEHSYRRSDRPDEAAMVKQLRALGYID